jgi:hypothetical protein
MSGRTFLATLICGLTAIAVQPLSAAATTPSLAGSWQFTLTPTASTPTVVPIPGLATFTTDGSVIETDGSEFASIPSSTAAAIKPSTPGHGIWQIGNTPITLFVQYISLVLNPDGSLLGRNITTMLLALNSTGDQFSGTYKTDEVIGSVTTVVSSGTVSGTLIPHVPVP